MRTALATIAPEADLDTVGPDEDLQEALDLDSMDFLNFLIAIAQSTAPCAGAGFGNPGRFANAGLDGALFGNFGSGFGCSAGVSSIRRSV